MKLSESYRASLAICGSELLLVIGITTAVFATVMCSVHNRPYFVNIDGVQSNFTTTSTTNDTFSYDLDLSISIRNPNQYYDVHHHKIEATTSYKNPANASIGSTVNLNSISQEPKSNAVLTPSFKGVINLKTGHEVSNLVVKLNLNLENNYKTPFLAWEAMSEFQCDLMVVSSINGQSFQTTTEACKVNFHRRFSFPTPSKVYFYLLIFLLGTGFLV